MYAISYVTPGVLFQVNTGETAALTTGWSQYWSQMPHGGIVCALVLVEKKRTIKWAPYKSKPSSLLGMVGEVRRSRLRG